MTARRRISELHPIVYKTRIAQKRLSRKLADLSRSVRFASAISSDKLPFNCKKHQSLLRRKLGDSDPTLQENKITNLSIACPDIDGLLIRPGETFSFWNRIGEATADKGYVEGMQLSQGEVVRGVGGGLCQLANLLYWMALHTPLVVVERHHHSFDPFPDENRVLPFGSGAGVFYNYIDLRFFNPTDNTFQINVWLTGEHLKGSILAANEPPHSYHVFERGHRFFQQNGDNYRENEIWREVIDRRTGDRVGEELIVKNRAMVKYELNFAAAGCNFYFMQNSGFDDEFEFDALTDGFDEDAESSEVDLDDIFGRDSDEFNEDDLDEFLTEPNDVDLRTAILEKNNMIGLLGIWSADSTATICRVDPREPAPSFQIYDDVGAAKQWFSRSLGSSRRNGWSVLYDGLPLRG